MYCVILRKGYWYILFKFPFTCWGIHFKEKIVLLQLLSWRSRIKIVCVNAFIIFLDSIQKNFQTLSSWKLLCRRKVNQVVNLRQNFNVSKETIRENLLKSGIKYYERKVHKPSYLQIIVRPIMLNTDITVSNYVL